MPAILHAVHPLPACPGPTVFLAGPTPRDPGTPSWRPTAIHLLFAAGFEGTVIVPETSDGHWKQSYDDQVDWECEMRDLADVIAFWVPRDMASMPSLTTNVEFGEDLASGRMLYGRPDDAPKNKYLDHRWTGVSGLPPFSDLPILMAEASRAAMSHATLPPRVRGAARIPAQAWSSPVLRDRLMRYGDDVDITAFRIERAVSRSAVVTRQRGLETPTSDPSLPFAAFTARMVLRQRSIDHHLVTRVDLAGSRLVEERS